MAYKVELRPDAANEFLKLDKAVGQRILRKLKWLTENYDSLTPETLTAQW